MCKKRPFVKKNCTSGIFLLLLKPKVNQKGKLAANCDRLQHCTNRKAILVLNWELDYLFKQQFSKLQDCVPVPFAARFQLYPIHCTVSKDCTFAIYIHTQHFGFWNWFPPVSGWFEQPWLVSHASISITSQQMTAGSLDQASHQPSEQLPGKGQYFWATDGYT